MKASDLDILLPQPQPTPGISLRWATVTEASPLRVRLDGDDTHMPVTPSSLEGDLVEGDRVLAAVSGRQLIVLGISGGPKLPAGLVAPYAGGAIPSGWLVCNGGLVSRTAYARLFAAIGTTYGSGDGSTTFALPNYKGRVLVGLDASQAEFDELGETGGAKVHTLTADEMPAHNHTPASPATTFINNYVSITGIQSGTGKAAGDASYTSGSTGNTGGGQAHNNLQPYAVAHYIIKA